MITFTGTVREARKTNANGQGTEKLLLLETVYPASDEDGSWEMWRVFDVPIPWKSSVDPRSLIGKKFTITVE